MVPPDPVLSGVRPPSLVGPLVLQAEGTPLLRNAEQCVTTRRTASQPDAPWLLLERTFAYDPFSHYRL